MATKSSNRHETYLYRKNVCLDLIFFSFLKITQVTWIRTIRPFHSSSAVPQWTHPSARRRHVPTVDVRIVTSCSRHLRSARPPAIRISTFLRKRVVIVAPYSSIPRTLCFVRGQECVTQGHHQHAVPQLLPLPPTVKILWLECNATTATMRSPCEISARVKKRR